MKVNLNDSKIERIRYGRDDTAHDIVVGIDGVTKIESVEHYCGEYSIHWITVYSDHGKILSRYNAASIDFIYYEDSI